jgi:hypothetical protein
MASSARAQQSPQGRRSLPVHGTGDCVGPRDVLKTPSCLTFLGRIDVAWSTDSNLWASRGAAFRGPISNCESGLNRDQNCYDAPLGTWPSPESLSLVRKGLPRLDMSQTSANVSQKPKSD